MLISGILERTTGDLSIKHTCSSAGTAPDLALGWAIESSTRSVSCRIAQLGNDIFAEVLNHRTPSMHLEDPEKLFVVSESVA